jgi:hypothetical protein
MTKKQAAALIEALAKEIAAKANCDQNSGRAFLVAAIRAKQAEIVRSALPVGSSQPDLPRVGPAGVVGVDALNGVLAS